MPSSAMSSQSACASTVVSSDITPLPAAREIIVDMGPNQIKFTAMARAAIIATPDCQRIKYFFDLENFLATTIAIMAAKSTTPKKIRYGTHNFKTLITSSQLMLNI
jgi:hypothetical protein